MLQSTSTTSSLHDEKSRAPERDVEKLAQDESHIDAATLPQTVSPYHPSQFPDGGKDAYLCLLGGFCCLFCSFGWLNCLGVFQNYYQMNQLRAYSPSTVAWISSLEIFVMFLPGPIVGWVYDNRKFAQAGCVGNILTLYLQLQTAQNISYCLELSSTSLA